jgi:hypothetical protein
MGVSSIYNTPHPGAAPCAPPRTDSSFSESDPVGKFTTKHVGAPIFGYPAKHQLLIHTSVIPAARPGK